MNLDFYIPTKVIFGPGRLDELSSCKLPGKKALIVITSNSTIQKLGYVDKVIDLLKKNNTSYAVFDQVQANPTRKGVMDAVKIAKTENCDFTIGLGGGSSIDSAKAIALMIKNSGDLWDYAYTGTGGKKKMSGAAPIVTITTTAGTGTETDPWFVITNEETSEKLDFNGVFLFPTISIIDPLLTKTVPARLTAFQGMDALFHAIEGYVAKCSTPLSDLFALQAVELIAKHLPEAVKDGNNTEARTNMAYAADILAGFVQFTSSCISLHLIGQTMGGLFPSIPHGASLIVIAERYFEKVVHSAPEKFARLAVALGADLTNIAFSQWPMAFIHQLKLLFINCGVDQLQMSTYSITRESLCEIAEQSYSKGYNVDPCEISLNDTVEILNKSYS